MTPTAITIDHAEPFPHLSKAPLVEAVIEFRARAADGFDEASSRGHFESKLTGYSFLDSSRTYQHSSKLENGELTTKVEDLGWKGMRFQSNDKTRIIQLNRDGFVFSHLRPYTAWQDFSTEALALWDVYRAIASPADVQRTGLRYINRIPLTQESTDLDTILQKGPTLPAGLTSLPVLEFLQQETLFVPGTPYLVRLARTLPPTLQDSGQEPGIIFDIDVFCSQVTDPEPAVLRPILEDLRWLKNKAFFGTLTKEALEQLK
ncbi:TIGR04255 family protein [Myxococcota bacterium]|nr:TIGR04255 family protein [Myxococcota bacterium]